MSDWHGLLNSDDFRMYRKRQAEVIAGIISHAVEQLINGKPLTVEILRGQLSVIKKLLRLPQTLTEDQGLIDQLELQFQEDIGNITKLLMREALQEE